MTFVVTPLIISMRVHTPRPLRHYSSLTYSNAKPLIFQRGVSFRTVRSESNQIRRNPVHRRHRHRQHMTAPNTALIRPVTSSTKARHTMTSHTRQSLPSSATVLFSNRRNANANPFIIPRLFRPFLMNSKNTIRQVTKFPQLRPNVITPTGLIPLIVINAHRQTRARQSTRTVQLSRFQRFGKVVPQAARRITRKLRGHRPSVIPRPCPVFHFPHGQAIMRQAV